MVKFPAEHALSNVFVTTAFSVLENRFNESHITIIVAEFTSTLCLCFKSDLINKIT